MDNYEDIELSEAVDNTGLKKVLATAKKIGAKIKGNTADFGEGAVIEFSIDDGKLKMDGGKHSGVEHFNTAKEAIDALTAGMDESVELEEAAATVQSVLKALRLKGGKEAEALIKKLRNLGLESTVSKADAEAAKKILKGQIAKFVKEEDQLEEAAAPFKSLEAAWLRTNGDKKKQERLIKKHELKPIISNVRPGAVKLGVLNKLQAKGKKPHTVAGLDAEGELIFVTNNPTKIYYPKANSKRPEGAEIKEASMETLRLRRVVELSVNESNADVIDGFLSESNVDLTWTPSNISREFDKYLKESEETLNEYRGGYRGRSSYGRGYGEVRFSPKGGGQKKAYWTIYNVTFKSGEEAVRMTFHSKASFEDAKEQIAIKMPDAVVKQITLFDKGYDYIDESVKLAEDKSLETTNELSKDEYEEVQNFQNFDKKDWKWVAAKKKYIRKKAIKESVEIETANSLTKDEYEEVQNFQNFDKKDWKWVAAKKKYIRKNPVNESFKVGQKVKVKLGPHKDVDHEIIAKRDDGRFNVRPIGLKPKDIAYKLGAVGAKESDLELIKEAKAETYDFLVITKLLRTLRLMPSEQSKIIIGLEGKGNKGVYTWDAIEQTLKQTGFGKFSAKLHGAIKPHMIGGSLGNKAWSVKEDTLEEAKDDKQKDIEDLEKMIKNPDQSKVKQYGGTKYVDMLKKKLSKLQEGLDAIGKEDDDVDNDGDTDASDKYLKKRRKAITKATKKDK